MRGDNETQEYTQKIRRAKNRLMALFITGFVPIFLGGRVFLHELGHYSFGYLFDKTQVEGINFHPLRFLEYLDKPTTLFSPAETVFKAGIFDVYGPWEAILIATGGLLFELAAVLFLIILLYQGLRNIEGIRSVERSWFVLGVYMGMFGIMQSWWIDFIKLANHLTANSAVINQGFFIARLLIICIYLVPLALFLRRLFMTTATALADEKGNLLI